MKTPNTDHCETKVVDATDNMAARYLLNDACFFLERPLISGAGGSLCFEPVRDLTLQFRML